MTEIYLTMAGNFFTPRDQEQTKCAVSLSSQSMYILGINAPHNDHIKNIEKDFNYPSILPGEYYVKDMCKFCIFEVQDTKLSNHF